MTTQQRLLARYLKDVRPGTLDWIGLRPGRKLAMHSVASATALEGLGLEGDHRCQKTPGSARQVSLISQEYIHQIEHFSGHSPISPLQLRRNLVLSKLNLTLLRHQRFGIGEAVFEATCACHPCSRMEQEVGEGTLAAMLGHGGLCARVLVSGQITVGDSVRIILPGE